MNSATLSQTNIILESLDVNMPDALAPTLHELFPGFEVISGTSLGDPIPNATYRQRLLCHPYTKYPMFSTEDVLRILNQSPLRYNPKSNDILGRPIPIEEDNVDKLFYVISLLKVRGIREDLLALQKAREQYTGIILKYPNGWDIPLVEIEHYFNNEL
jgi:hypothetical protein